jgi:hypothetical protein
VVIVTMIVVIVMIIVVLVARTPALQHGVIDVLVRPLEEVVEEQKVGRAQHVHVGLAIELLAERLGVHAPFRLSLAIVLLKLSVSVRRGLIKKLCQKAQHHDDGLELMLLDRNLVG